MIFKWSYNFDSQREYMIVERRSKTVFVPIDMSMAPHDWIKQYSVGKKYNWERQFKIWAHDKSIILPLDEPNDILKEILKPITT